jgi:CheY-like chemotaxis protein
MKMPDKAPPVGPLSILVAEDSPLHRRHTLRLLESAGHQVVVVNNGREAIEAWTSGRFDVLLMDVEMPVVDGLTATRMIREQETDDRPRLPIIAVTSTDRQEACLRAGMDAFLSKPLEADALQNTLVTLLERTAA